MKIFISFKQTKANQNNAMQHNMKKCAPKKVQGTSKKYGLTFKIQIDYIG